MTSDEIECIEEGGAQLTIALLRTLSATLRAGGDPTAGQIACTGGR
jgi:hypothetical protein